MSNEMSVMALACLGRQEEVKLAPVIDLAELEDIYRSIAEEQKATGGTVLYRVKIPSGGGKAFDILTGDEETDTSVASFSGVIVHHHRCNALFPEEVQGNTPPICSSNDGAVGYDSETGTARSCDGCPYNEYGTSKKGRRKACKNMHRLYIMAPGVAIPLVLCLPPTSLRSVQDYLLKSLAARKLKPSEVLTEFSVGVAQNADGIKYSTVKFKLLGKLSEADRQAAEFFSTGMKLAASSSSVSAEDYNREPASPNLDVSFGDGDIPF